MKEVDIRPVGVANIGRIFRNYCLEFRFGRRIYRYLYGRFPAGIPRSGAVCTAFGAAGPFRRNGTKKTMEERLILVTNDDGYDSRGMEAAVEVARTFGRVVVVAPETTQSGMSQAITMYSPLYLRSVREEEGLAVYAFSGTPVDCVKMAFDCLLRDERVDLVLSGINHGSNSAVNVLYSGTMGAAIEGSFYGCPAVGLSLDDHAADADFEAAVLYGRRIVGAVLDHGAELPLCLNVNVPKGRPGEVRGVRLCRQNRGFWREEFFRREDPRGRPYFWLTGEFVNGEPGATDTDEWALAHGYVSVVPVQADLTDYRQLKRLDGMFE